MRQDIESTTKAVQSMVEDKKTVMERPNMTIPPDLQDRLIEVLRLAHDNALEVYEDASQRYKGYKQHRIDALGAEAVETETVLFEILKLKAGEA